MAEVGCSYLLCLLDPVQEWRDALVVAAGQASLGRNDPAVPALKALGSLGKDELRLAMSPGTCPEDV